MKSNTGYAHVYEDTRVKRARKYRAYLRIDGKSVVNAYHLTAREAAIAIDKTLIRLGKDPVNILKRIK